MKYTQVNRRHVQTIQESIKTYGIRGSFASSSASSFVFVFFPFPFLFFLSFPISKLQAALKSLNKKINLLNTNILHQFTTHLQLHVKLVYNLCTQKKGRKLCIIK